MDVAPVTGAWQPQPGAREGDCRFLLPGRFPGGCRGHSAPESVRQGLPHSLQAARGFCVFPSFLFLPFQPCAFSPCSRPSTSQAGRGHRPGRSARPRPSQASSPQAPPRQWLPQGRWPAGGRGAFPCPRGCGCPPLTRRGRPSGRAPSTARDGLPDPDPPPQRMTSQRGILAGNRIPGGAYRGL